ncbi:MAG: hypothetical protein K0Q50_1525 [Vampirovibrio sp.]|nr:hypothetical protein [Vampirovibrio sp.]
MSFDRMDNYAAYSGKPPRLPQSTSKPKHHQDTDSQWFDMAGRAAVPTAAAANHSLLKQWADKAAIWGSEDFASAFVNKATAPNTKAGQAISKAQQSKVELVNKSLGNQSHSSTVKPVATSYSELFHLKSENFAPKEFNWSNYTETVNRNLATFKQNIQTDGGKHFFKGVSPKGYVKNTVIENNIKPFRDVWNNAPDKQIGTAAIRAGAMGLMGFDVLKHTHDAYKLAKAKEDGSIRSKLHTLKETTTAFGKYSVRDGATWEAAGIGAAIGKAVIPVALGGVSLGGIAAGALVGLGVQRMLDKTLKTGSKDPVQIARQKQKEQQKAADQDNPFRVNALSDKGKQQL